MIARRHFLRAATAIASINLGLGLAQAESEPRKPDVGRGAVIAAQGTTTGAPACALCHAFNGGSDGSGAFPRIATQPASYLAQQLRAFASGVRANAVMSPVAKALSPGDIADVTAYYASVKAPYLPLPKPASALSKRGEQLAKVGSAAKQLQACDNCHGPGGTGEPPAIPYLAGQYAQYITFELQMWQRGYRKNSQEVMLRIAGKLDDQDIAALAAYYQQVLGSGQTPALQQEVR
jgi:cytochrome c553